MQAQEQSFARVLGRGDVLAVAFGAMIGFGWIVLTGGFLESAGSLGAALAFVIGGTVVVFVGLTYAELVTAMPKAGGEHHYVLRGLGARPAFVTSWSLALGYISVVAFEAVAFPQSLLYLVPELETGRLWSVAGFDVYAAWAAVGIVGAVIITALNYVGVRPAAVFQNVAVLLLAAVGVALLLGAGVGGETGNLQPLFTGGVGGIISVLVATPFLFVGFDVIPQTAEEINVPHRQVGRLLVVSVLLAAAWYIMVMLTVSAALPAGDLAAAELPTADAMRELWNSDLMATVLVLGGLAGIVTSWNAFLIGASRLLYAMAVSGMVPAWLGRLHPRYRTPGNAILLIGGLSVVAPLFGRQMLVWLVTAGGLAIVIAYLLVAVSFLALRRSEPDLERPFKVGPATFVGTMAVLLSLGLGVLYLPGMPAALLAPEWVIVGLWWAAGLVFLLRLPAVPASADAEERLIAATRGSRP